MVKQELLQRNQSTSTISKSIQKCQLKELAINKFILFVFENYLGKRTLLLVANLLVLKPVN